jgi:hypothetical protein
MAQPLGQPDRLDVKDLATMLGATSAKVFGSEKGRRRKSTIPSDWLKLLLRTRS